MIQASQAEKNRAAAASKYKKEVDKGDGGFGQGVGTLSGQGKLPTAGDSKKEFNNKVYVSGLVDALGQVSESDIRQVGILQFYIYSGLSLLVMLTRSNSQETLSLAKTRVTLL